MDGVEQVAMTAARQVRPTDRPREQDVSDLSQTLYPINEDDVPRCVARAVNDGQRLPPDRYDVVIVEPAIRCQRWHRWQSEHLTLDRQRIQQECVVTVRTDHRDPQLSSKGAGAADMVDVPVGQQDLLHRQARFGHGLADEVNVTAGIYDCPLERLVAPQEGAVLLEGGDRNDAVSHGLMSTRCSARGRMLDGQADNVGVMRARSCTSGP